MSLLDSWNSPKYVLAPMVDGSELAWRMLGRKYGVQLTFTPMINSTAFLINMKYRRSCLQFASEDRPLIIQFCANSPDTFVRCAKMVQPFCDAVDLNLGCPQGIAKRGHYGAFLQDEWNSLKEIVSRASLELNVPVTCKIRIFSDVERTVQYAKLLEAAGASMLTVHGRTREMKGQKTGLADWNQIRAVKETQPLFMKKVKEGYSRIATGLYSESYLITSLATVKDRQKSVLCSFLSYHDTMSCTDHLSAFSNQSQSRQIMHDVEFAGTTFTEHVQATEVGVSKW
ncbi:unnamed protein product [Schistosoma margrebowiei]|uniref:tRNA-dihydrouridine(16/17) synthase [NAD(P)(+)] n=1 Tax=Schistosoma margrebowiei TaxID=48269 RepID=A0A183MZ68_9TREM|nr:unnamed protein product [Schistosoma margrebowiei]